MRSINLKNTNLAWISLLLALPAAYFLIITFLKYKAGVNAPYDAIAPFHGSTGIKERTGWNINLLILSGPVTAFILCIFRVVKIKLQFTQNHLLFQFLLKKRWLPLLVIAFSVSLSGIFFIYLAGMNTVIH